MPGSATPGWKEEKNTTQNATQIPSSGMPLLMTQKKRRKGEQRANAKSNPYSQRQTKIQPIGKKMPIGFQLEKRTHQLQRHKKKR